MNRQRILLLAQIALAAIVLGFAARALITYWHDFRAHSTGLQLDWGWIAASGAAFLFAYVVLVQTWRAVLAAWSSRIGFVDAAHIFAVSSLARYVPGKLWQIGALSVLAKRAGAEPAAAAGAAIVSTVANIVTGLLVVVVTSWSLAGVAYRLAGARAGLVLVIASGILLMAAPLAWPHLRRLAARLTGRAVTLENLPVRAVVYAGVGNALAWIIYGAAFQMVSRGVLGIAVGNTSSFVAVYAMSYIFGYLVLFAPAGVGFRESAMILIMPAAGLANPAQAAVMAIASRLWLTILETLPGLLFLMLHTVGPTRDTSTPPDAKS